MKLVINDDFGGFGISDGAREVLGLGKYDRVDRTNPLLVKMVEKDAEATRGAYSSLCVVEIPDEATDYMINEYDGAETVYYVLNGKIYEAFEPENEDEEED